MEPIIELADPCACRTRQLYDSIYSVCLVDNPSQCPNANLVRITYLCNQVFNHYVAEETDSYHGKL